MASIHDNLQAVRQRIAHAARAAGRDPRSVTLLAVSKAHPAARVEEALAAGQSAFGENYVQEALEKMDLLRGRGIAPPESGIQWHLIGPLQSIKTRLAAARFDWVQTVASERIAQRLSEQRPESLASLDILLQVNISGEATKSGILPDRIVPVARAASALPRLRLRGLMAVPEPGADAARYRELKRLYDTLRDEFRLDTLSVGTSDDLELAIAEGATLVRVGSAIFGARQKVRPAA